MPRVKCPKCNKVETVLRSGFVRQKQRYFCKDCNYNFTLIHENRKANNKSRRSNQTTIVDIAKALGISATTVSRALHDHPDISNHTKQAVKKLSLEMDYHPNLLARSFANKETKTVGVIIPNLEATFFSSMLGGIQKEASGAGYKVLMCQSNESYQTEVENVHLLMDSRVDGLLICHSMESNVFDHITFYSNKGAPIVHFYRVSMKTETSKVLAKNIEGAEKITRHLIEQGCQRIAMILGPKSLLITKERLTGHLNVLKERDLLTNKKYRIHTDFSYEQITAAVDKLISLPEPPDAIFCMSDRTGLYVIKHLKKLKIKVPQEIAVAGFGNDLMGELIEPGLTTYDIRTSEIGSIAMRLFLEEIGHDNQSKLRIETVEGDIVVRDSSLKSDSVG